MLGKKIEKWFSKRSEEISSETFLTAKEKLFCLHYANCFNAATAAIKAGYLSKNAVEVGAKLLRKPCVVAEIMENRKGIGQAVSLCQADILQRYMAIAFSDLTDYVEFGCEEVETPGKGCKNANFVKLRPSATINGGVLSQISVDGDKVTIKAEDRLKALDWLASYYKMNPLEKQKIEVEKYKLQAEKSEKYDKNEPLQIEIRRKEGDNDCIEGD